MLAPWKKIYDQPRQGIKKQRHFFANKGSSSQSYDFSSSHVWIWELDYKESWVLKNWCFCTVVLEKTLKSPLTARGSNKSILKDINPEYSLGRLLLKLKLQYFDHLVGAANSLEKTLILGKIKDKRRRGQQRMRWLIASSIQWTWIWANTGKQWRTEELGMLQFTGPQRVRHDLATEQQQQNNKIINNW